MEVKKIDVADITYEQFIEEHWKPGIPLVLKNATKVWGAYDTFSPDFFRSRFGDRRTVVDGKEYTMNEILDLVEGKVTSIVRRRSLSSNVISALPVEDSIRAVKSYLPGTFNS